MKSEAEMQQQQIWQHTRSENQIYAWWVERTKHKLTVSYHISCRTEIALEMNNVDYFCDEPAHCGL